MPRSSAPAEPGRPAPAGPSRPSPHAGALRFATARRSDVAKIVVLVESAYRGAASRRGWTTEADLVEGQRTDADAVGALVGDPATSVLLACENEVIVGCCALGAARRGRARLSMLAVAPACQRGGVGRAILEEAARRARLELGAAVVDLAVLAPRAELRAWYGRRGFAETGRTEPFPYGDARFGLPVRDDLYFVILERRLVEAEGR